MAKSIREMTAAEYNEYCRSNPEDLKKMDEEVAQKLTGKPQAFFKNGVLVESTEVTQHVLNGVIK